MLEKNSKYQIFPELTLAEFESLKASIAERGVDIPIIVDQDGETIDGFHREKACDELGIFCPKQVRCFDSDSERLELAVTANCKRRQLDREQRRHLIAAYLKADPAIADNFLAQLIGGISKNTVADVRRELEATCLIAKLTEFRGRDGKTRPRNYARVMASSPKELETALAVVKDVPANGKTLDVTTAARRARRHAKKAQREGQVVTPLPADAIKLYHYPFQQLEQVAGIVPGSVALFYADIPYDGEFVRQVADLAAMAEKVLCDGGICAVLSGQYSLNRVMASLDQHLDYQWVKVTVWDGPGNVIHPLNLISKCKLILIFSKGDWSGHGRWHDLSHIGAAEKDWHQWQQPLAEVETLVRDFSDPGDLVVDVCGGSFTTALACRNLGRRCISCDCDEQAVLAGQERLVAQQPTQDAKGHVEQANGPSPQPQDNETTNNDIAAADAVSPTAAEPKAAKKPTRSRRAEALTPYVTNAMSHYPNGLRLASIVGKVIQAGYNTKNTNVKNAVYKLLGTLRQKGKVVKDKTTKRFRLTQTHPAKQADLNANG